MKIPRFWRYSLRGLLLLTVGCCVMLGWWTNHARVQRRARLAVENAEGWMHYSYEYDRDGKRVQNAEPLGPDWLRERLGDEYFTSIRSISARWSMLRDDHLVAIGGLPSLQNLSTNHAWAGSTVGTFVFVPDEHRNQGHYLNGSYQRFVEDAPVTDAGLAYLASCRNLEYLILYNTSATNEGIAALSGLTRLRTLMIDSPNITDGAVEHFARMSSLERLCVHATSITAQGMAKLKAALPQCEVLY